MRSLVVATLGVFLVIDLPAARGETPDERVETAARRYRIAVYESLREDRPAYDHHRQLGDDLLDRWEAAGCPEDSAEALAAWFDTARELAGAKSSELPAAPEIVAEVPEVELPAAGDTVAETGSADEPDHPSTSPINSASSPTEATPAETTPAESTGAEGTLGESTGAEPAAAAAEVPADEITPVNDEAATTAPPAAEAPVSEASAPAARASGVSSAPLLKAVGGALWRAVAE